MAAKRFRIGSETDGNRRLLAEAAIPLAAIGRW
jgi:hypothetical protein